MKRRSSVKSNKDNAISYKTKLGVKMFVVYSIVYATFVVLNTTNPELMELIICGQTAAVIWGFGLIVLTLAMAIVYHHLCTKAEKRMNS